MIGIIGAMDSEVEALFAQMSSKEKININTEEYNRNFIRNIMEMLVFRTNMRYKRELERMDENSSEIVRTKTKIRTEDATSRWLAEEELEEEFKGHTSFPHKAVKSCFL